MAVAARIKGEDRRAVAVIGDGAMSAGMAFEAMNNAGISGADLLVILNDNDTGPVPGKSIVVAALQHRPPQRQGNAVQVAASGA